MVNLKCLPFNCSYNAKTYNTKSYNAEFKLKHYPLLGQVWNLQLNSLYCESSGIMPRIAIGNLIE